MGIHNKTIWLMCDEQYDRHKSTKYPTEHQLYQIFTCGSILSHIGDRKIDSIYSNIFPHTVTRIMWTTT